MKWLFAVLVALNMIVFGGMVAYRMGDRPSEKVGGPVEHRTQELSRPESLNVRPEPQAQAVPEWVAASEPAGVVSEPESEEAVAARQKQEQEAKLAKEKKEREEKAKREREAKAKEREKEKERERNAEWQPANQNTGNKSSGAQQCIQTASVTIDEDDYHRIKGLLSRWPHAASRSVERRGASKSQAKTAKSFRVLLPTEGDAMAKLESLGNKGFSGVIHHGELSMGVTRSRSAAQILISRLAAAGFGGARIAEQNEGETMEGGLSVARMTVTFMAVNPGDVRDIRNVVERYGPLNVKACR